MNKLSDAAKQYLADYKILKVVNSELDTFLNELVIKIRNNLETDLIEPNKSKYKKLWIWLNQTENGYFEFGFLNEYKNRDYPDGKVYIIYSDPRQLDDYDKSNVIEIDVSTSSTRKRFEKEFNKIDKDIFETKTFDIDLDNSENTVNSICEFITDKFYKIDKAFKILNEMKIN